MPGLKMSGLRKEFDKRLRVWNLIKLEEKLLDSHEKLSSSTQAYIIRQVLDDIAPNWRTAKSDLELDLEF